MTFFETELRKILNPLKMAVVYVGGTSAYIPLPTVKIRVDFHYSHTYQHYDELLVKAIEFDEKGRLNLSHKDAIPKN